MNNGNPDATDHDNRPDYASIITTGGVDVRLAPAIITPALVKPIRNNRYEGGEVRALREEPHPGDRVLELGAGIGLLSTIAGQADGVERVVVVEANPDMIPLPHDQKACDTHRERAWALLDLPAFRESRCRILENAWDADPA